MTDVTVLQSLIDDGSIIRVLKQGSDRRASIKVCRKACIILVLARR